VPRRRAAWMALTYSPESGKPVSGRRHNRKNDVRTSSWCVAQLSSRYKLCPATPAAPNGREIRRRDRPNSRGLTTLPFFATISRLTGRSCQRRFVGPFLNIGCDANSCGKRSSLFTAVSHMGLVAIGFARAIGHSMIGHGEIPPSAFAVQRIKNRL